MNINFSYKTINNTVVTYEGLDDLHYNYRRVDGCRKLYNCIISGREAGKSVGYLLFKILYPVMAKGETILYIVRYANAITPALIQSMTSRVQKMLCDQAYFYTRGSSNDGIVRLYFNYQKFDYFCGFIAALNLPTDKLKSLDLPKVHYMIFDEFILQPSKEKNKERYIENEARKIKDIYTTLRRSEVYENALKIYLCGNTYSRYAPILLDLKIDTRKMKVGAFLQGDLWVLDNYELKKELRDKILKANPLYQFDKDYSSFAFNAHYISDEKIPVESFYSHSWKLFRVICYNDIFMGIYRIRKGNTKFKFYVKEIDEETSKKVPAIHYSMIDADGHSRWIKIIDFQKQFRWLYIALSNRQVAFENINLFYLLEECCN